MNDPGDSQPDNDAITPEQYDRIRLILQGASDLAREVQAASREHAAIERHFRVLRRIWADGRPALLKLWLPNPDPVLRNAATVSNLHTFDFWLN